MFGICRLIDILVPDVPKSLEIKIRRERYLAKQALADSETILKVSFYKCHFNKKNLTKKFIYLSDIIKALISSTDLCFQVCKVSEFIVENRSVSWWLYL